MRIFLFSLISALLILQSRPTCAQPVALPGAEFRIAVDRYRAALVAGDIKSVAELLTLGSLVMIDGEMVLARDFLVNRPARDRRHPCVLVSSPNFYTIAYLGEVKLMSSTFVMFTTVGDQTMSISCAETVVFHQNSDKWLIHAIHWSSNAAK
jgi:hypothetical protein